MSWLAPPPPRPHAYAICVDTCSSHRPRLAHPAAHRECALPLMRCRSRRKPEIKTQPVAAHRGRQNRSDPPWQLHRDNASALLLPSSLHMYSLRGPGRDVNTQEHESEAGDRRVAIEGLLLILVGQDPARDYDYPSAPNARAPRLPSCGSTRSTYARLILYEYLTHSIEKPLLPENTDEHCEMDPRLREITQAK